MRNPTTTSVNHTGDTLVISLGGSLLVPGEIDILYIKKITTLLKKVSSRFHRIVVVCGGGVVARKYQEVLKKVGKPKNEDLDLMGIAATRLNAQMIALALGSLADKTIITDPSIEHKTGKKILVAGGWAPGRSSDDAAVRLAHTYGSHTVINLTNIAYVYSADPRKDKKAQPLPNLTWNEYKKIVGGTWKPGANFPFDPVAAQFAARHGKTVIVADGKDIANLEKCLKGKGFRGTVIE